MIALLLDLANILGGFLLANALLAQTPNVGEDLRLFAARLAPWGWLVGIVALVTSGYYLILHLSVGPHVFHFELVGLAVGIALLWDRLHGSRVDRAPDRSGVTGAGLVLAIFGIIAIIVGFQGILTPDG